MPKDKIHMFSLTQTLTFVFCMCSDKDESDYKPTISIDGQSRKLKTVCVKGEGKGHMRYESGKKAT